MPLRKRGRAMLTVLNPETLGAPRGYSNGILAPAGGRILFVAGQIGWDREGRIVSEDFAAQFDRALANVLEVVRAAGGQPENVGRMTLYVADRHEYNAALRQVGEAYRRHMGRHYPAMALLEVKALLEPGAKVEIEATAVIP
ncbi:MAG: RidA family protein [Candidatus Eremiobacterota bacterium]